jgi:hypothetical protein
MPSRIAHSIRRNQLIAPFGVGAIHILRGSKAVVTGGLDFWFKDAVDPTRPAHPEQVAAVSFDDEPRLQARLGVSHFRLPPGPETVGSVYPRLEIPLFAFPTWYICPDCCFMDQRGLSEVGTPTCQRDTCKEAKVPLRQVSFATACDHGHLQDFPWREWVHRESNPSCMQALQYKAGGSGSLEDIVIICGCKKARNLAGIMSEQPDENSDETGGRKVASVLSSRLLEQPGDRGERAAIFHCLGGRVWLGEPAGSCRRHMRAVLVNATNVHYSQVKSAVWIPPATPAGRLAELRAYLRKRFGVIVKLKKTLNERIDRIAEDLLESARERFEDVTLNDVIQALSPDDETGSGADETLSEEEQIRYPEYKQLQLARESKDVEDDDLEVTKWSQMQVEALSRGMNNMIAGVSLAVKLRETRVLAGFTRIVPDAVDGAPSPLGHMWQRRPSSLQERWLPAAIVYGEGIFILFNHERLTEWEAGLSRERISFNALVAREFASAQRMGREPRTLTPKFIALHTLAHLAIRRLVFACGYGSASLRERLYISDNPNSRMAGMLIYTASGDSEGSLGGLVSMGAPDRLGALLEEAVDDAVWCSSDPVCGDVGRGGGQGVDGLNGAACHCCALLPETSCELFNSYLDRELVCSLFKPVS